MVSWITSLTTRITAGVLVFTLLALFDLRKNGSNATKWREYLFLLVCVLSALTYGVLNDQLTSRISWEYYFYGKGLAETFPPQTPPDARALHIAAVKIGLQATWTAGLLVGVALLLANNKSKTLPQLSYRRLAKRLLLVFAVTIPTAALLGLLGSKGLLNAFGNDFKEMFARNEWRPERFVGVYGIHLGGYVGGLLGTSAAVISVRRGRRGLRNSPQ